MLQARKNNLSGSNDPHQLQHDANEQLINGAKIAAAADVLGLEDEETIQLLMRQQDKYSRRQLRDVDTSEVYRANKASVPAEIKGFKSRLNTDSNIGDLVDPMDAVERGKRSHRRIHRSQAVCTQNSEISRTGHHQRKSAV